jgi:hypothetical protein
VSFAVDVYVKSLPNAEIESALTTRVAVLGGRLDYREDANEHTGVCLTYEFDDHDKAAQAVAVLRQLGEHVEGPMVYAA